MVRLAGEVDMEDIGQPVARARARGSSPRSGVTPLPALMKRISRERIGEAKLALDLAEVDHRARLAPAA